MKRKYVLKFDRVNAAGVIDKQYAIDSASLEGARVAFVAVRDALHSQGDRTAHACIVGPQGEVYSVDEIAVTAHDRPK